MDGERLMSKKSNYIDNYALLECFRISDEANQVLSLKRQKGWFRRWILGLAERFFRWIDEMPDNKSFKSNDLTVILDKNN